MVNLFKIDSYNLIKCIFDINVIYVFIWIFSIICHHYRHFFYFYFKINYFEVYLPNYARNNNNNSNLII